jgi:hypothetical protein
MFSNRLAIELGGNSILQDFKKTSYDFKRLQEFHETSQDVQGLHEISSNFK